MTELLPLSEGAQLALDTLLLKPTRGIPSFAFHVLKHAYIDRLAGVEEGSYRKEPIRVYRQMQERIGTCLVDQWIPTNPLTMTDQGYDAGTKHEATTGAEQIVCDGRVIDSPEAVVEHLERVEFPKLQAATRNFDEDARVQEILAGEAETQRVIGAGMLKTGHGFARFPGFAYGRYGYVHYFTAYGLLPEVIERHFSLQADYWSVHNGAVARAYREGHLPPLYRLDHDMADSRGTLVDIKSLDRIWLPHFARSVEPLLKAGVRLIWHTDGNMMAMVPRLLEAGVKGFQGFQYECGMDYEKLSATKTRDGEDLVLLAGLSSTDGVLRSGTPADVRKKLRWIVEKGPRTGLFIASMGVYPDMPWENVQAYVEGIQDARHRAGYRRNRRDQTAPGRIHHHVPHARPGRGLRGAQQPVDDRAPHPVGHPHAGQKPSRTGSGHPTHRRPYPVRLAAPVVMRGIHIAIVDEADSPLIDEAVIPSKPRLRKRLWMNVLTYVSKGG
jgi:hypothetical protein